jgi:hypothetical protein
MVAGHRSSGASYRQELVSIIDRATKFEEYARESYRALGIDDPQRLAWQRIERRYATIRGNALHLLIIHDRRQQRHQPLYRLRRYLHLL